MKRLGHIRLKEDYALCHKQHLLPEEILFRFMFTHFAQSNELFDIHS